MLPFLLVCESYPNMLPFLLECDMQAGPSEESYDPGVPFTFGVPEDLASNGKAPSQSVASSGGAKRGTAKKYTPTPRDGKK